VDVVRVDESDGKAMVGEAVSELEQWKDVALRRVGDEQSVG
jgi:hypothetical protein